MNRAMLLKGFRPVRMSRDMTRDVLKLVEVDKRAPAIFGERAKRLIDHFVVNLRVALSRKGDPIEFWCTHLQQVYVCHILLMDCIARESPFGDARRDAKGILEEAWRYTTESLSGEINRGTWAKTVVPEPTSQRLADCGFRDNAHLERHFPGNRINVYSFANRSEMETYYLRGWCSVLAVAVHERTGWPLVGVFDPWEKRYPMHVACRSPDGSYVDAKGCGQGLEEFSEPYRKWLDCPVEVREMQLDQVLSCFPLHPHYHDLARDEHLDVLLPDLEMQGAPAFA